MLYLPTILSVLLVVTTDGDETWWSLRPVARPEVPKHDSPWVRTPIDAFILAKLKEHGLTPSAEADRRTLNRRLTYDLHGLPPTPKEIEAFVNDRRPDAYELLVDRLLESPRYGERWGRHWLDVVHFGETHGYDKDKRRPNAWPFRDYVIRSLNQDKPYSRFVEEQIAGDVLYPDNPDGIVATGFIAAGPWDFVGHVELPETKTDGLIARSNDRDDMVATTMSTFTSVTAHCARCHDHKFDPIAQKDYYRLQAVFAGVDRADRPYDSDEAVFVQRRALTKEKNSLDVRLKAVSERIGEITSPELHRLDGRLDGLKREVAALPDPASSPTNGYHSAISATRDAVKWVQVDLGQSVPLDEVKLLPARPTDFPDTPGFGFPLRFRVEASDDAEFKSPAMLLDHTNMDAPSPGDSPFVVAGQSRRARFVRVTAMRLWERTNDFVFALGELKVYSGGQNVARGATVTALDSIEAGRWSKTHLVDGFNSRRRLGDGADPNDPPASKRQELEKKIQTLATERQSVLSSLLDRDTKAELDSVTQQLGELNARLAALPPPKLVYAGTRQFVRQGNFGPPSTPRPIHLLNRGDVKQPGELMSSGALSCLPALEHHFELTDPADEGARRAALARWITDHDNVLARRSIVNRVWQYHFGRGIVDTPNDFGRMGSMPTHPELLDWLAVWFRENGESFKKLHKLILASSVYRQSWRGHAEFGAIDSDNHYLWRMNRTRLDAESIRDATLFVSGKLDLSMGGPSVDHFFFKDDHSPVYDYTRFDVDSPASNRRSVYRFIVRSVPDPFMECLDCADPSLLVPKRNTTLTALQALAMLNDRVIVRAAEYFAERVSKLSDDRAVQIDAAFRLALGRPPQPQELESLQAYAAQHGLANACRLILNSNEFVFID